MIHEEGPWYRYQGRLTRYSRTEQVWFTRTDLGQPGVRLTDADFLPQVKEEDHQEESSGQPAEKEPKPQIKTETPEPTTLSFFPDDNEDNNMATREINICIPTDFTGDRTKTSKFLSKVSLYLKVNSAIYDTNEKKIVFALSFMNGGMAGAFAEMKGKEEDLGTWKDFKESVEKMFSPINDAACQSSPSQNETPETKEGGIGRLHHEVPAPRSQVWNRRRHLADRILHRWTPP